MLVFVGTDFTDNKFIVLCYVDMYTIIKITWLHVYMCLKKYQTGVSGVLVLSTLLTTITTSWFYVHCACLPKALY